MIKPNFFIIGAPKCGTTALSEYLKEHPQIFISDPKEPHFFATDFPDYPKSSSLEEYLCLFEPVTEQHLAIGEASVMYLYSSEAVSNLYEFNPQAKIIVMLRNPLDLVYSYHSQLLLNGYENEPDFTKAWKLQPLRNQGQGICRVCTEPKVLQYRAVGKLGEQMTRLMKIFPKEQIYPILFDDFVADTKSVYQGVLDFLEVPSDFKTDFAPINQNKAQRVTWLSQFTEKPPTWLYSVADTTKQLLGIERLRVMDAIRSVNVYQTKRKPLDERFRWQLIDEFQEDIQQLSYLLNQNLDGWLK